MIKLALATLLAAVLTAQASFDYFDVQRNIFSDTADGLRRAMDACERTLAENPDHAQALVWHGIGTMLKARKDPDQGAALRQQGFAEMDRAVMLAPDDLTVRIPRGATLMAIARQMPQSPARDGLFEAARTDFQLAFDLQNQAGVLDSIGTHPLGELLQGLGDVYSRLGRRNEARTFYSLLRAKLPETEYARRAGEWLTDEQPLRAERTACIGCHMVGR